MKPTQKQLFCSLLFTFVYGLGLVPASYAVDGCSSPGFKVATNINLEAGQFGMAVADFNGDGHLDLVTANRRSDDVTVLLGHSGGSFAPAPGSPFLTGRGVWRLAVADLNGDTKLDVVTTNLESKSVGILLGQ